MIAIDIKHNKKINHNKIFSLLPHVCYIVQKKDDLLKLYINLSIDDVYPILYIGYKTCKHISPQFCHENLSFIDDLIERQNILIRENKECKLLIVIEDSNYEELIKLAPYLKSHKISICLINSNNMLDDEHIKNVLTFCNDIKLNIDFLIYEKLLNVEKLFIDEELMYENFIKRHRKKLKTWYISQINIDLLQKFVTIMKKKDIVYIGEKKVDYITNYNFDFENVEDRNNKDTLLIIEDEFCDIRNNSLEKVILLHRFYNLQLCIVNYKDYKLHPSLKYQIDYAIFDISDISNITFMKKMFDLKNSDKYKNQKKIAILNFKTNVYNNNIL